MSFAFDNGYARLPERFYERAKPEAVAAPELVRLNTGLAADLQLDVDALQNGQGAALFAGNTLPEGADPIAQAYAGHQFGHFVPQLGDGRAILLGEAQARDGRRLDIALKGSGPTRFSRRGDGRAALGPVMREYIVSEAMHALGIPTTRALAFATTGETVYREVPLPGAVLTRVAASHVRVGTFEYFAVRKDVEALRLLADYCIDRHYPDARDSEHPMLALLKAVTEAQARLIARWMEVGFIHGVMNTDNTSISGETIDYGPCAFMDTYDPATVYSSIDHGGRYAYGNQPQIAQWNLASLAGSLLPLLETEIPDARDHAQAAIDAFPDLFAGHWIEGMGIKLGIASPGHDDRKLIEDLLNLMKRQEADFTNTFRALAETVPAESALPPSLAGDPDATAWLDTWRARLALDGRDPEAVSAAMNARNPAFIPRNHRVEEAIKAGVDGDFAPMDGLIQVLSRPFEDQPDNAAYAAPPADNERVLQTFCGT